ncbi:Cilia- and flagella-associated protein 44 [Hypsibius exemplaris]|uniref:Cilia- and flagella-associated protein 44 n=1 Tax=Hypsibius exemplaris TaxID=2072580 RepID=A0A1W0WYH9_HYPEX|nr:Cilia- and flagella-associated protein 44 [Hypsibius exemplaris]
MWSLPGESSDEELPTATEGPGRGLTKSSVTALDGPSVKRINRPKFDSDYPTSSVLNAAVIDEEWPIKVPVLELVHAYGCDSKRRDNLQVLSESEFIYVAGGFTVIHDVYTKDQRFLQPSVGCCPKQVVIHPSKAFIAVSEKGPVAGVNIFEFPSLRLVVRLHCDGDKDINFIDFKFSNFHPGQIVTSGIDHIKFWTYQSTDVGWELHCVNGRFGSRATSTIECFVTLILGSVISATADGTIYKWVDGEIHSEVVRASDGEHLHDGIVTNMICNGRDLITMGTDGFVKIWKWDQLEGPNSNPDGLMLEVYAALDLGRQHVPVYLVPCVEGIVANAPLIWYVMGDKGIIWRSSIQPGDTQSAPVEIFHMHSGVVTGLAVSDHDLFLATVGEDGNIRVYSPATRECIAFYAGSQEVGATSVIWIHPNQAGDQRVLMVGYNEGTVRLFEMPEIQEIKIPSEDSDEDVLDPFGVIVPVLREISNRRVQIGEIVELVSNEKSGFVASLSADSTLLLLTVQLPDILPMSLYGIKSPLHLSFRRTGEELEMLALITTGIGIVYEVQLPTDLREDTLIDLNKLRDDPDSTKKLTPITDLWHRTFQLKSIKARLQTVESDLPLAESRIVWGMYDPLDGRNFWMTTLDVDSGYVYHCAFGQEGPTEPLQALKVDPFVDLTIKFVQFLDQGHLLVVATTDGQVQILLLRRNYKLDTRIATWSFKLHDGMINGMSTSHDFTRLFSCGADGNVLDFNLVVPQSEEVIKERMYFKEILATLQTTKMTDKEERDMATFLREDRLMREQAERDKEAMAERIDKLRDEIRAILLENMTLPCELRIPKEDFILHANVRAAVEGDFARRNGDAQSYEIAERVRGRIIEDRLTEYFRVDLHRAPEFRLKSFSSAKRHISTYWIQKIDDDLPSKISALRTKLTLQMNSAKDVVKSSGDTFSLENTAKPITIAPFEEPDSRGQEQNSNVTGREWERRRYADHLDRARLRRQEWRDLLNRKPNLSEENDLFLDSEQKRISGQEYKIKQNEDHAIQFMAEYLHAPQVELELLELRQQVFRQKVQFNTRLVDLRAEKVQRIVGYREIRTKLQQLHRSISVDQRLWLSDVQDLDRDEEPEPFRRPTRDECLKVFNESLKNETKKDKPIPKTSFMEETDDKLNNTLSEKKPRYARLQSFATRQTRISLLEQVNAAAFEETTSWDELQYEMSQEEKLEQGKDTSLLLYRQDQLISQGCRILAIFDGKLNLLRHDKYALDIELKRADLHLLIYKWEHKVLSDYEDREYELSREEKKLLLRQATTERRIRMMEPDIRILQRRLSSRFQKRNSQASPMEFDSTDIFVCPRDLDKKVFQSMHSLNHQYQRVRRDMDDEIERNRVILCVSYEAQEELAFIEFELSHVSGSLQEVRLEKFNRWKDIPCPVAVRMSQFQFPEEPIKRSDLHDALVFDERNLEKISAFIDQVKRETTDDSKHLAALKDEFEKLEREQIIFSLRIEELKKECKMAMVQKYGGIIDLDAADRVRTDPKIQEIQEAIKENQKGQDKLLADLKQQAADLNVELTNTRAETTIFLKTIAAHMSERDLLVKRTTKRADKIGRGVLENVTTEDLRSHQEKLIMWQTRQRLRPLKSNPSHRNLIFQTETGWTTSTNLPLKTQRLQHPKLPFRDPAFQMSSSPIFVEPPKESDENRSYSLEKPVGPLLPRQT